METEKTLKVRDDLKLVGVSCPIQVGPVQMLAVAVVLVATDDDGHVTSTAIMGSSLEKIEDSMDLEIAMQSQFARVRHCGEVN